MRVLESWPDPKRPNVRTVLLVVAPAAEEAPEIGGRLESLWRGGIHGQVLAMRPVNSPQLDLRPGDSVIAVDVEVDRR